MLESPELVFVAAELKAISERLGIRLLFKTSFDKANRSSGGVFAAPVWRSLLAQLKQELGVQLTDIHESLKPQRLVRWWSSYCRQTDLLVWQPSGCRGWASVVNVKKGQFLAPWDMAQVVSKLREAIAGLRACYNTLVVDGAPAGLPCDFDATHSVQQPGGRGSSTGGQREFVAPLARAAMAVGVDGLFIETHPDPDQALSDGPNMVPLQRLEPLLEQLLAIRAAATAQPEAVSSL